MTNPRRAFVLGVLFVVFTAPYRFSAGAPAPTSGPITGGHYLISGTVDPVTVLPPPPEIGSIPGRADLEAVRQAQAWRSPAQVAWAKRIADGDVFDNADVLGSWFTAANLPFTEHFVELVEDDLAGVVSRAKGVFNRPRPPKVDPRIAPCVHLPSSGSYPSGHSSAIYARAEVLAEVFPDQREALFAWADRAAWARVLGGVHFPTDVVAGRVLAEAVIDAMRKNPEFATAIERCKAEAAPFVVKKAA
jgi:acid phosphatase (class A)